MESTRAGAAAADRTEAGCEGGGVHRKCELFQACRPSRSWALFQNPPVADGRFPGALLLLPKQLTLIPELGDMKVSLLCTYRQYTRLITSGGSQKKKGKNMKGTKDQRDSSSASQWNRG